MIKSSIEKIADSIGFDIALSDDHTQAMLLNGLGKGFKMMQPSDFSTQCCYIVKDLTPEARNLITELAGFIELETK